MNRKTTCLALAGKWGGLGASRYRSAPADPFGAPPASSAASTLAEKIPWRDRRSIRARPANPPPTSQRNSRRDRPHGVGLGMNRQELGVGVIGRMFPTD